MARTSSRLPVLKARAAAAGAANHDSQTNANVSVSAPVNVAGRRGLRCCGIKANCSIGRVYGSNYPVCRNCKDFFAFQAKRRANPKQARRRIPDTSIEATECRLRFCAAAGMNMQQVGCRKTSRAMTEAVRLDEQTYRAYPIVNGTAGCAVCAMMNGSDSPSSAVGEDFASVNSMSDDAESILRESDVIEL